MEAALTPTLPTPEVITFFKTLADETRLTIVRLLMYTDLRAGELIDRLQLPPNAVSYHLKQLRTCGLLRDRRSSLDARDVYYSVNLTRLQALYTTAGTTLHPGMTAPNDEPEAEHVEQALPKLERPLRILYLCTHNRARSQLAEGFTRFLAVGQVEVSSAGNQPSTIHPLTVEMLEEMGIDTTTMSSKLMDQFCDQQFDYIITTCDRIRESCPTFPGDARQVHWSFPDPSEVEGDDEARRQAFRTTRREMLTRIRYLLSLPHPGTGERLKLRSLSPFERGQA